MAGLRDQTPGNFVLFPAVPKSAKQPTHRGKAACPFCQKQMAMAGWDKTSRNGPFVSGTLQAPRDEQTQTREPGEDTDPFA